MTDQALIYLERDNKEDLLDNQVQKQNQSYILPVNINIQSQNNSNPDKNNNCSSMDLANKSQSQNSQVFQKKNDTPHDLNDPIIQPLYPPSEDFDQKVLPVNNNITQTQTPGNINYIIQPDAPVYQDRYEIYSNINEIPHGGIKEIDENTFYISNNDCAMKVFFSIFFIIGLGELIFWLLDIILNIAKRNLVFLFKGEIFGLFGYIGLLQCCKNIYFTKQANSLIVIKKELCRKKIKNYNAGELERVDFFLDKNQYKIIIYLTNGEQQRICSLGNCFFNFTNEEIGYFLFHINSHIQNKMFG